MPEIIFVSDETIGLILMAQKLNTHFYDGKLNARFEELRAKVLSPIDLEICWNEIHSLITSKLHGKKMEIAMMIWNQLKRDVGSHANFDQKSNIRVESLLPLVWTLVRSWEDSGKSLFLEQWIDIERGMCPQGRVARLLQIA